MKRTKEQKIAELKKLIPCPASRKAKRGDKAIKSFGCVYS